MATMVMKTATAIALVRALSAPPLVAAAADTPPASWAATIAPLERQDGLLPLFIDRAGGRVLVQLPAAGPDGVMTRVIHHTALRTGVGSAETGLDRAQIGATRILAFRRMGNRILAEWWPPARTGRCWSISPGS